MRNSTRAAALAASALAVGALALPAASAASTGTIRVCISGLEGTDAGVEVNRFGPGGRHIREADPCHTFSGLRPGGFGILLAKAMVDELLYNEKHNEVVMVKYLPA